MSYLKIYLNTVYCNQLSLHCCLGFSISISFFNYCQVLIPEPFRTVISVIYFIITIVHTTLLNYFSNE